MVTDRTTAFTVPLVRALARLGVRHACITPGSRSTPLAMAFADAPEITDWSHLDERSSAFFALGIARTLRLPVAIVTTSGTAAAELHPALAEARLSRVPLIALTADRPFQLRDVGAPQTMDQQGMFGNSVVWSHDVESTADPDPAHIVALAARLVDHATGGAGGPVHLNVRYHEPLMPAIDPPESPEPPAVIAGRLEPSPDAIAEISSLVGGRRGVVIAGPHDDPAAAPAVAAFAAAAGWPVLADALSGLRFGPHDRVSVLAHADALAAARHLDAADPEWVIRFGALPTSKATWRWLENHPEVPQVLIEPYGWRDPMASAATIVRADPSAVLTALAEGDSDPAPRGWLEGWLDADARAGAAIGKALGSVGISEPGVARSVAGSMPEDGIVWLASSMPVRDFDTFAGTGERELRVMANRGVNGIDGFISTALGSAAVSGQPTVAVAGDLSVIHDLGALVTAARLDVPITIIAVNNDGGGIFHFLPQEGHPHFERHFGTPHGLDLAAIATAIGITGRTVEDPDDLAASITEPPARPTLLEVRTNRVENADLHRRIGVAVREALGTES